MEKDDLFDFELNEAEGYWSVKGYRGKDKELVFPSSHEGKPVKTIGDNFSLYNKKIKHIVIPEGFTSIGGQAFEGCTELTDIRLPESLTSIECSAFSGCMGLANIKLPEGLTSIEGSAFDGTGLTSIKLPESLTSFSRHTWGDTSENCTGLTDIIVDENNPVFCSVEGVMFDKAMTTLLWFPDGKKGKYSVPDGIIIIRHGAFGNCRELTSISFPQSLLVIQNYDYNCEQLTEIKVSELNTDYYSIDGVLFAKGSNTLLQYPKNKDKTDYDVPNGTLNIGKAAFHRCRHLVNITLPESVRLIDYYAFAECEGLKTITLPMSLRYIGGFVFEDCPNLETITL